MVALLNHAQPGSNTRLAVTILITLMQPVRLAPQAGVLSVTGYPATRRMTWLEWQCVVLRR